MLTLDLICSPEDALPADAIPIYSLGHIVFSSGNLDSNPDGWADVEWPANIPASLRTLAQANHFVGRKGAVLANEEGVLFGLGDDVDAQEDPLIFAALSEQLPAGHYIFKSGHERANANLIALAWLLGTYQYTQYKNAQRHPAAKLVCPPGTDIDEVRNMAEAMGYVRDLVNTPAEDLLPSDLEEQARILAATFNADCDVTVGEELIKENFPLIHAVGRASDNAPRLIDLHWAPEGSSGSADTKLPKITLVGKGVCFDSGGLNIKADRGMALMKKDMGGAAHALGLARMIMQAKLPVRLRVLIAAVENAISGNALRPSDVIRGRQGLTIEIGNTDAEGRLVISDAMTLAGEENPDLMITLATLTGAARVAMGPEVVPFYTDNDDLAKAMQAASRTVFDPAWRLPMWSRYQSMLASRVADMNNIASNGFAGSMIAALFLRNFVPDPQRWIHFDLYAWRPSREPGRPIGGEAQCIRALFSLIREQYGTSS